MLTLWTLCVIAVVLVFVAGLAASMLLKRRDAHRLLSMQMTRRNLAEAQAKVKQLTTNAKHGKAARAKHDLDERLQFMAIKARGFALDAAKVADSLAAHLAGELDE